MAVRAAVVVVSRVRRPYDHPTPRETNAFSAYDSDSSCPTVHQRNVRRDGGGVWRIQLSHTPPAPAPSPKLNGAVFDLPPHRMPTRWGRRPKVLGLTVARICPMCIFTVVRVTNRGGSAQAALLTTIVAALCAQLPAGNRPDCC